MKKEKKNKRKNTYRKKTIFNKKGNRKKELKLNQLQKLKLLFCKKNSQSKPKLNYHIKRQIDRWIIKLGKS